MRYLFGDYTLDADRRELCRTGQPVHVEPQVFDLLLYVIGNRGRVVTKDDLMAGVWGGRIVAESTLGNRINAARHVIGDSGERQQFIRTVARRGIMFVGDVREEVAGGSRAAGSAPAMGGATAEEAKPALALPDKPSIAVLPFANLSDDPQQEYFADGMAEEIITALSRCGWLFVIARNSSFTYKSKNVDVRQVGRELGVRYVLEGSVRKSGERLRFTAQLIEADSGNHIWADRFEGDLHDVFELQDRITESVVGAIEPQLQRAEIDRLRQKSVTSLDAYDLYLRALQLESEFTETSLTEAGHCLRFAYTLDPGYASAMALAGWFYFERACNGWVKDRTAEGAAVLNLAQRAIELNSYDPNVLWMSASSFWFLNADAERGRELFSRSLSTNPNSPMALTMSAWPEMAFGELDTAMERIGRAMRLSPRDPREWMMSASMGMAKMWDRNFAESVVWCDRAILQNPRMLPALRVKIVALAHLGEREKAAEVVKDVLKIDPKFSISTWRNQRAPAAYRSENPFWNVFYEGLRAAGVPE